jgi:uncharacterized protein (TIGR03000 family)
MLARPVTAGQVVLACLGALLFTQAVPPASAQSYARRGTVSAAVVEVRLPAAAELWFDGMATTLAGERRIFTTPPLRAGLTYSYEVQVRWREGGQDVLRSERAIVRAGEAVVVDFTQFQANEGRPDHMAVREIVPAAPPARVVSAAHDSLMNLAPGAAPARRLTGYMAVNEVVPSSRGSGAARPGPAVPAYMSIVEFDTPRH